MLSLNWRVLNSQIKNSSQIFRYTVLTKVSAIYAINRRHSTSLMDLMALPPPTLSPTPTQLQATFVARLQFQLQHMRVVSIATGLTSLLPHVLSLLISRSLLLLQICLEMDHTHNQYRSIYCQKTVCECIHSPTLVLIIIRLSLLYTLQKLLAAQYM